MQLGPDSVGGTGERLKVVCDERASANAPPAPSHLLDNAPHRLAHAFAFDRDHRVREPLDDLLLLRCREYPRDDRYLDERHVVSWWVVVVDIVRSNDAPHIGQIPDIAPRTLRADPLTLATVLAHRAFIDVPRGDLTSVEADAHE